jgi:CRP-like cAMP-binding protein
MNRVEMVVFLQGVDLFSFCTAEQVLQVAAISRECAFAAGEVVYRRNQSPDALYCVVEGRVEVVGEAEQRTLVGPQGRFGVLEILSGRLRVADAVAATATRSLRIEAEDFFDLLSNNIEIVKALFRQVTRSSPTVAGGIL